MPFFLPWASRTDSNIMDGEAAGKARAPMAAKSEARRRYEASQLRKRNHEMSSRLNRVGVYTDNNLMDEGARTTPRATDYFSQARL